MVLYSHLLLESWQANIDIQIMVDKGKVFRYLIKYVIKLEMAITYGIKALIYNILYQCVDLGLSLIAVLKWVIAKLLREWIIYK